MLVTELKGQPDAESWEAVSERVRVIRMLHGLSQRKMGVEIGISQSGWSLLESGSRSPNAAQLLNIERCLGYPREWVQSGITTRMPRELREKVADTLDALRGPLGYPGHRHPPLRAS